jgi:hypothetical protein
METVFVLGAGASADAGVPMMQDFLEKAMSLTPSNPDVERAFALVAKARSALQLAQSKARLDIRNVESVFAAFEMAELFGQLGTLTATKITGLTDAMRTAIVRTIERHMVVPVQNGLIGTPAFTADSVR